MNFLKKIQADARQFRSELQKAVKKTASGTAKHEFGAVDYTIPNIPCIIEKKNDPWVYYGENNLYPQQVSDLRTGSGIHNSILKTKTKMTAGDGFLINDAKDEAESQAKYAALPSAVKTEYDFLFKMLVSEGIINKLADDFQMHGAFSYELVFNIDFTRIAKVKYVNVENLRSGKIINDKIESYWYSRDWAQSRKAEYKPREVKSFDPENKTDLNQLVYEKVGKNDYYGELPYKGCITWIMTDFKMGLYHLSNIDNGMNPGIWFKFYKLPADDNDKARILADLRKTYQGATKTNKMVVTFSESKEVAPDIAPVQNSNLDKQLLLLAELCDKKILTGHQLTSPLLAGISVSGQLGGNTELQTAYQIFDKVAMEADRNFLAASLQKIFEYNKVPVKIAINPFNPFKNVTPKA